MDEDNNFYGFLLSGSSKMEFEIYFCFGNVSLASFVVCSFTDVFRQSLVKSCFV